MNLRHVSTLDGETFSFPACLLLLIYGVKVMVIKMLLL